MNQQLTNAKGARTFMNVQRAKLCPNTIFDDRKAGNAEMVQYDTNGALASLNVC